MTIVEAVIACGCVASGDVWTSEDGWRRCTRVGVRWVMQGWERQEGRCEGCWLEQCLRSGHTQGEGRKSMASRSEGGSVGRESSNLNLNSNLCTVV